MNADSTANLRILLFSDSHGYMQGMMNVLNRSGKIDLIIHLGDYVRDALKLMELYRDIPVEFVRGNNDWGRAHPEEKILELQGNRILITHGHLYSVKYDYSSLLSRGKSSGADAVFFGHTHVQEEFLSDGMLVLNPGSAGSRIYSGNPTCSLIQIREGRIISRFMECE